MNVLVVSISAPPSSGAESIQVHRCLKYLSKKTKLDVVTTTIENKGWKAADSSLLPSREVRFHRYKLYHNFIFEKIAHKLSKNNFPDSYWKFHKKSKQVIKDLTHKPDIIYSRATPHSSSVLALKLKKKLNIPWVMHMSDPWVDNPYNNYSPRELDYCNRMEKECFQFADRISLTSELTVKLYRKKYPEFADKFLVFSNSFDGESVSERKQMDFNQKLKIAHTGNFYGKRNPKFLLNVLMKLDEKKFLENIEFTFAGHMDEDSLKLVEEAGLNQVKNVGSVSSLESIELQKNSDILLVIDKPFETDVDNCFLPSKVIDYMVARKYIIGITDKGSSTCQFVQNRYGKCFSYNESSSLEKHLMMLIEGFNRKDSHIFDVNEIDYTYSASENARRLLELFEELI